MPCLDGAELQRHFLELKEELWLLHDREPEVFKELFHSGGITDNNILPVRLVKNLHVLGFSAISGKQVASRFAVTKLGRLFIVSDFPNYVGDEEVAGCVMPLHPENISLLKNLPDCRGRSVLEIGFGSGVNLVAVARLHPQSIKGTDVNPRAIGFTICNALLNSVDPSSMDMIIQGRKEPSHIFASIERKVDVIIANPPFEYGREYFGASLKRYGSSGSRGLDFIEALIKGSEEILHTSGTAVFVFFSPGGPARPDGLVSLIKRHWRYRAEIRYARNPIETSRFIKDIVGSNGLIAEGDEHYWHGVVRLEKRPGQIHVICEPEVEDWHLPLRFSFRCNPDSVPVLFG